MEYSIQISQEDLADAFNSFLGADEEETSTGSADTVTLAEDGAGAYLADAGITVLIGIVVVLGTLIVLTAIFKVFGLIMSSSKKKAAPAEQAAAAPVPAPVSAPAPAVQNGISDEVVAVIAAAVASMAPEGKRYAIKSVSRSRGERPVWAAAGLADSTRPF